MKIRVYIAAILLATLCFASANDGMRSWKFIDGKDLTAELLDYEEKSGKVSLRMEDKTIFQSRYTEFSLVDQAWLLQWLEYMEEMRAILKNLNGTLERHEGIGKFTTEYTVYHPSGTMPREQRPLLILFHPGGNGHSQILRYVEAAEAVKMTLVSCETFQNLGDSPTIEAEYLERFKELLPQIEKAVLHDAKRMFMGGISGGGWRAFHYSAQVNRPWAGIYANCSWLGGEKYWDLPYPKMRVVMVTGNKDYGSRSVENDVRVIQKSGSDVSVQSFEGGHQAAPASVMTKAFRWLLKEIE